jgi:hypothetical protein
MEPHRTIDELVQCFGRGINQLFFVARIKERELVYRDIASSAFFKYKLSTRHLLRPATPLPCEQLHYQCPRLAWRCRFEFLSPRPKPVILLLAIIATLMGGVLHKGYAAANHTDDGELRPEHGSI